MIEIFQILLSESFWSASLRIATPLIFGVLGALICEKSGVLNLGIEGIFVAGAMAGWMAVWLRKIGSFNSYIYNIDTKILCFIINTFFN